MKYWILIGSMFCFFTGVAMDQIYMSLFPIPEKVICSEDTPVYKEYMVNLQGCEISNKEIEEELEECRWDLSNMEYEKGRYQQILEQLFNRGSK